MALRWPMVTLLNRELRLDGRNWRVYLFRTVMLVVILISLVASEQASRFRGAPGKDFFAALMVINLVLVTLAGLSVFAAAITEEKEAMTLGLLRMTALNPLTILLGKSTAKVMTVLLLVIAQVPFTMLAVTMGGISLTQIAAAYVLLGAYVVFVANAALLCSVTCRRTIWATLVMLVMLGMLFALPAWFGEEGTSSWRYGIYGGQLPWWLPLAKACRLWTEQATAFGGMVTIFSSGFNGPILSVAVLTNLGLGGFCFLVSRLVFDRFTRDLQEPAPMRGMLGLTRKGWRLLGAGRAWRQAILWKEFFFTSGGWTGLATKGLLVWLLMGGIIHLTGGMDIQHLAGFFMGSAIVLAAIEVTVYAARMFAVERHWNTLSSLVTLPMSARELWYAKLVGVLPNLVVPLILFGLGGVLAPRMLGDALSDLLDAEGTLYAVCVIAFFLHLLVWLTLRMRRWALLTALGSMFVLMMALNIAVALAVMFVGNEAINLLRLFLLGLGLVAVILHLRIPSDIERTASLE